MAKDRDELLAAYVDARDAVTVHLAAQAGAEVALARWQKAHRGIPPELLYHRDGTAMDPELEALEAAVVDAQAAVRWCQAVEVAAAEEYKGETLGAVMERNARGRDRAMDARVRAENTLAGG